VLADAAHNLWIADIGNSRVLGFDAPADRDGDGLADMDDADDDGDGIADLVEVGCASDPVDVTPPLSRPERVDGAFAGADDDGDTQVDEPLPGGASSFDCDGDGYTGAAEDGASLCGNGVDDDGAGPVFDDTVVNDGCPGGPPQSGAYSEAEFNIGTSDQDPCGNDGWPSDLASGGVPNSTNRVTITDLTSFLAPVLRLNTSPGDEGFSSRWDLRPRSGQFVIWIAINDLTTLLSGSSGSPPMFGGARAFNGPVCPWAP
jgi:hypothetical protein